MKLKEELDKIQKGESVKDINAIFNVLLHPYSLKLRVFYLNGFFYKLYPVL